MQDGKGQSKCTVLKKKKSYQRWTAKEKAELISLWGQEAPEVISQKLNRSVKALRHKLSREIGRSSATRGLTSVNRLAEQTDYDRSMIDRAIRSLKIRLVRVAGVTHKPYKLMTNEDVVRVLNHLATKSMFLTRSGHQADRWARKWDCCRKCGTNGIAKQQRHAANGYCARCARWLRGQK